MRIRVTAHGELQEHFGPEAQLFDCGEGATLQDLLLLWEARWGERLPPGLWNWMEHRFRGPVVIRVGDRISRDRACPLHDGMEVRLYRALVGG